MCIRDASGRVVQRGLPPPPSIDEAGSMADNPAGLLPLRTVQLPTGLALTAPPPMSSKKATAPRKVSAATASTQHEPRQVSPSLMSISSGRAPPATSTPAPTLASSTATPLASTLAAASASFVAPENALCLRRQHVPPPSDPEPLQNYKLSADYEVDDSYTTEAESQAKEGWKLVWRDANVSRSSVSRTRRQFCSWQVRATTSTI